MYNVYTCLYCIILSLCAYQVPSHLRLLHCCSLRQSRTCTAPLLRSSCWRHATSMTLCSQPVAPGGPPAARLTGQLLDIRRGQRVMVRLCFMSQPCRLWWLKMDDRWWHLTQSGLPHCQLGLFESYQYPNHDSNDRMITPQYSRFTISKTIIEAGSSKTEESFCQKIPGLFQQHLAPFVRWSNPFPLH